MTPNRMIFSSTKPVMIMVTIIIIYMARDGTSHPGVPPPSNCTRSCGGMNDIPYPFGLNDGSEDCYLSDDLSLTCNRNFNPPKLFYGNIEITDIMLSSGELRVLANISYDYYNSTDPYQGPGRTWFSSFSDMVVLSHTKNVFTAIGCDTAATFAIGPDSYGGCISGCSDMDSVVDEQCFGIGCCQFSVPRRVDKYETGFYLRKNRSEVYKFNNCSYSFLVENNNYTFRKSDLTYMDPQRSFPMILDWYIGNQSCIEAKRDKTTYACVDENSECFNSTNGPGYICNCSQGYQGNPYLLGECQDINECQLDRDLYPCKGKCVNTEGSYNCTCPEGQNSSDAKTERCIPEQVSARSMIPLGVRVTIGIICSILLLLVVVLLYCVGYQSRKNTNLRKKFFENNGGVFLEQALSSNHSGAFRIFKKGELEKATKNFSKDHIIGFGGYGEVYKGFLEDKTTIAVKRSMVVDDKNGKEFANEILVLSRVNHRNIVKLLGCCLESKIPMLVYEYVSKGTLSSYLHNKMHWPSISFSTHLRIAIEAARAINYLHQDASPPIFHGDIKSSNILLDEGFIAKVSDFGTSTLAPKNDSQFKTLIQGTNGYIDPEFVITGYLTDKSDVFSFGVVLVELLTRKLPFNYDAQVVEQKSLSSNFLSCVSENKLKEILDPEIMGEGISDEVMKVVNIYVHCLGMKGKERPTMREVVMNLEEARVGEEHPWEKPHDLEEESHSLLRETDLSFMVESSTSTSQVLTTEDAHGR